MPAPVITTAPDAPLRTQAPATFVTKAEAFVDWQAGLPTELNAFGDYLNGLGLDPGDSLLAENNLSDVADVGESQENLGFVVLADQAAYDALDPPVSGTFYFIPEA